MTIRTRFAPSPTGFMHVGGIRTALFAWLYARQQSGQFILRIEDTDKKREESGSIQHIKDSLEWLGLKWDEDYLQSERLAIYRQHAQMLIDKGLAYTDPYTPKQVQAFRDQAKADKRAFLFRDQRPQDMAVADDWYQHTPLRFKVPELKRYEWSDAVRGQLSAGEEALDDFVLIKADGFPTYNFAHIVDDHLMNVSHVMRGEEFIASTPKFLSLIDALGWDRPVMVTLPPVLNKDGGKKLSKRDGAQDVLFYRDAGYLPQALANFLASLGWNDGTDQEIFTIDELVAKFSLERIQSSGAKFDEDKLQWIDWQHFKHLVTSDLPTALTHLDIAPGDADQDYLQTAAGLAINKAGSTDDFKQQMAIFLQTPDFKLNDESLKVIDNDLQPDVAGAYLGSAAERLQAIKEWSSDNIEQTLRTAAEQAGAQPRIFLNLVRWAVSGSKVSPSLFDLLYVLGQERTLGRLQRAL